LQPLTEPLRHKGSILWARFSHDGRRVVTASEDGTARVWDARTGQPTGEPLAHRAAVKGAEFSPDGLVIATASLDGTARLWDATTGRPVAEPFVHGGEVMNVRFNRDGRRLLTVASVDGPRTWDVPPNVTDHSESGQPSGFGVRQSAGAFGGGEIQKRQRTAAVQVATARNPPLESALLADLAEAVVGKRVSAHGALENVSPTALDEVRQRVSALPRDADFTRWLEWFFADRSTRTLSPYSQMSVPDYVASRADETNAISGREALMLCPTNGIAFAQIAAHLLQQSPQPGTPEAARVEWASRQAVKFAPLDARVWRQRIDVVLHTGGWTNLLAESERMIELHPGNAYFWNSKARGLEAIEQWDAMLAACDRTLEIWHREKHFQADRDLRRDTLFKRIIAFRQLGRLAEAGADNTVAWDLPARDSHAGSSLIDLGLFYNGGDRQEFPGRVQRLAGTDFDFRGWIHLDFRGTRPDIKGLPELVDGIPVEQACRRLHFLHTLSHASKTEPGMGGVREEKLRVPFGVEVGHYTIHYADGAQVNIPIVHGRDVRDYFDWPSSSRDDPALVVAWTGATADSRRVGAKTRLYKSTWDNPRPDVPIRALDFVHARTHAVPILVAITAEP